MSKKWFIIGLVSSALGVGSALGEHEHGDKKAAVNETEESAPDTVAGHWGEAKEHAEHLGTVISEKKLDDVHEIAFEIRDHINALADTSGDLPADKLEKVKADARSVADLAEKLDESGDAGNQAETEANYNKLKTLLDSIQAQYPPEMLKSGESEGGHESAVTYTCPMHPEVVSDAPGKCPKCGMKLIQKR